MNNYIVTLVKINQIPYSIGVGGFCFNIADGIVMDNVNQRIGSEIQMKLKRYNESFELAKLAWEIQEFDEVEEH